MSALLLFNLLFAFNLELIHKLCQKLKYSSITNISEFIGPGKDFIPSELPTNRAVIQKGILLKEQKSITCNLRQNKYSNRDFASDVFQLVLSQWRKANVNFQQPVIIGGK